MRFLKYIFYFLLILFIIEQFYPVFYILTKNDKTTSFNEDILEETKVSVTYELFKNKSIIFSIPNGTKNIRVLSNLNIKSNSIDKDKLYQYSIKYNIYDSNNNLLYKDSYYHTTKVVTFQDIKTKKDIFTRFYINKDIIPASTRKFIIPIEHIKNSSKIEFYIDSIDPKAKNIVIRNYHEVYLPKRKRFEMYQRLKDKTKNSIAKGNVYPHELLTIDEKLNLMAKSWEPFGPLGVMGKDYTNQNLYTKIDIEKLQEEFVLLADKLLKNKKAVFSLDLNKTYILNTYLLDTNSSKLTFNFYDENRTLTTSFYQQNNSIDKIEFKNKKGELEIYANKDIAIEFLDSNNEKQISQKIYSKSFLVDNNTTLEYKISHIYNLATPIRINYRYLENKNKNSSLKIDIGNKKISLLADGNISRDIIYNDSNIDANISNNHQRFINIPNRYKSIKVSSKSKMVVNISVLIPNLSWKNIYNNDDIPNFINWHILEPINKNDTQKIVIEQSKKIEPFIFNSDFSHKILEPIGSYKVRSIILQKDALYPLKYYQYNSLYKKLPLDSLIKGEFKSIDGIDTLTPKIYYKKNSIRKTILKFYLDNILIYELSLKNLYGSFNLPYIKKGKHILKVVVKGDKGIDLLMNNIFDLEDSRKNLFFIRDIYKLDKDLKFKIEKKDNKPINISFRLYGKEFKNKIKLSAKIYGVKQKNLDIFETFSPLKKEFYIYPLKEYNKNGLFLKQNGTIFEYGVFGFPILDNIPIGDYYIKISIDKNIKNSLYFYIYEPKEKLDDKIYIFKEEL